MLLVDCESGYGFDCEGDSGCEGDSDCEIVNVLPTISWWWAWMLCVWSFVF